MAGNYTCTDIKNAFTALTGQISPRLWNKVAPTDPWLSMTPRGVFPTGMGFTISNMMLERTVTDSETGTEWTTAVQSASGSDTPGAPNNCVPTPEQLKFGQTLRPFTLARRDIQTEEFCINDLTYDFQIEKVLANVMDILGFVSDWVWFNTIQNNYITNADHKITVKLTGTNYEGTSFSAADPPTARLSNVDLENAYQDLVMNGAYLDGGSIGKGANDQPIFSLFTDAVTSRDLIRQDPDLRMDFRYADPDKLINPLGTPYSYNGFKHVWIKYPPRYEIVNGAWVRIYPFTSPTSTTKGWKRELNPAYKYATYQDSFIFVPMVQTILFEEPKTNPGGGVKFDYASHMGEFQFLVIRDKNCNPRGELGFFDALFAAGFEPGQTYLGWVFRHLHCGPIGIKKSCLNYS